MTRTELDAIRARNVRTTRHSWMQADADRRALLAYVEELLRVIQERAETCANCDGTGVTRSKRQTCPACGDLREVLPG